MTNEKTLLLVDDDAEDRLIIEEVFAQLEMPAAISFAGNGEDALSMLATLEQTTLPSLIVLDQNMPRLTGTQVLRMLKADPLLQNIPVVMLSTSRNRTEEVACAAAGAVGYLQKPTSFDEYLEIGKQLYSMAQESGNAVVGA